MTRICSRCGADLPEEARYCSRCGAPAELPLSAERRMVSVLFADLTDSTQLAARLDPERFRELQSAFYREASERIAALRGRTEKFAGDSVMAVFGFPHSHDDDALRAVRAAMEIRDRAGRLGEELGLGQPLRVRIGINSGQVVVGSGPADQFLVSGPAVNLAARLQQAAAPGEILAGETTRSLTMTSVSFGADRSVAAKGFDEPVAAAPVEALSIRSSRRTIPLVGRRREMTLLRETLERARETSRLHLVTVLGEPGIGKTRLVDEFLSSVPEDVRVLRGRAGRFEEDAVFASIAEMLRAEIGADESDASDVVLSKLRRRVEEVCPPDESTATTIERLALALGVGEESGRGRERPYRLAEVRAGLMSYLGGLAREGGPVVVAFEDLELAPADLLELIEQIAVRGRRLAGVALCAGRDEMLHVRSGWLREVTDAITMRLDPLTDDEAVELARASGGDLADETADRIARHAGGNPFFIVETTGMLIHERGEHATTETPLLPATVHAVVAARIDHLDAQAREVVRKASVFPHSSFDSTDLAIVVNASGDTLARLEDEELFVRDPERRGLWRFRHAVVRAVAYDSLAKRERLQLHLAVAERLRAQERYPAAVAHHLELAARASLDLDPSDRSIAERAVDALQHAGDLARRRMESGTAIDRYTRALALAGPEDGWTAREAHVLCGMGESHYWLGEFPAARSELERALLVAPDDAWSRSIAHRVIGDIAMNIDGDLSLAERHLEEALGAARELEPPHGSYALARTLLIAGWAPYYARSDIERAKAMFTEAMEVAAANPAGDPWAVARALTFIASLISSVGHEAECLPLLEEAMEIGRSMKDPFTTAVARQRYGQSLAVLGRLDEAFEHLEAAVATMSELGARWETASALGELGEHRRGSGDAAGAETPLREALDICRELGDRTLLGWVAGELARALRALGRHDEARAVLDGAAPLVDLDAEAPALRAKALLAVDAGDEKGAREALDRALDMARQRGYPNTIARAAWFAGRLLGPEAAGGEQAMRDARRRLEEAGWVLWLEEPDFPFAGSV